MKLSDRTVLFTGGTSGIGLELARQLAQRKNVVIVTGRDQAKLDAAKKDGRKSVLLLVDRQGDLRFYALKIAKG